MEFERSYEQALVQNEELQQRVEKSESYVQKLEGRIRSLEKRMDENSRNYKEAERQKRELAAMVSRPLILHSHWVIYITTHTLQTVDL